LLEITALPVYEHPLTERVRTFLRLEFLFQQARHGISEGPPWGTRQAINSLLDLLTVLARGDVKSEVIKELDGYLTLMRRIEDTGDNDVNEERLSKVIHELEGHLEILQGLEHQPGHALRDHDFLNAIRQRSSIPGGACDFDLPSLHNWMLSSEDDQRSDLNQWYGELFQLDQAVQLALEILRNSANEEELVAEGGSYHQQLDSQRPIELLRITPVSHPGLFPEISGGRHRISIRFLEQPDWWGRPQQPPGDIEFRLACCII